MLTIDGSLGEGGGQILRTALALALVTARPFRMENIRARRKKPGLLHQHLTAVNAAAKVGNAQVAGAALGSGQLTFVPAEVTPGDYHFNVGTAGSATLVLQTILPALALARAPSRVTLEGGTHNPLAPPFEFLERAFLPVLNRMGPRLGIALERHGFYPGGGGKISASIQPCARLMPLDLLERGEIRRREAHALVASLPRHIAERELGLIANQLGWPAECLKVEQIRDARGPGNAVLIEIGSEHITEIFTAFGELGVRAETVAEKAVKEAQAYLTAGVAVGEHLADQLLLPFALAGSGSFKTLPLSSHAATNIEIVRQFLPVEISAQQKAEHAFVITVKGSGSTS